MTIFFRTRSKQSTTTISPHPEFGDIQFIKIRNARSIRLFVKPFEGVIVKFPHGISERKAISFIDSKNEWIRHALERAQFTEKESIEHYSRNIGVSNSTIRSSLTKRLDELALQYDFQYNKISLRDQKSRWGSCSAHNNISLNKKLYFLPDHLRDYVLIHELAHTRQKNHSPAFWKILFVIFGALETKQMRRGLKAFDYLFYPPPEAA